MTESSRGFGANGLDDLATIKAADERMLMPDPETATIRIGDPLVRFASFLYRPGSGVMVVLLLTGMLATVASRLALYAIEDHAGPLVRRATSGPAVSQPLPANDEDDDDEYEERGEGEHGDRSGGGGEFWAETRDVLANLMLLLIVLHIVGVLLASYVHHENLARAMITGRKRAPSA